MIGRTVSHYRILAELGRGGMGVLYRARDERLRREVALKFLPEPAARNRIAEDRFLREARAASALNHPAICTIYDIGEDQGYSFLVMELLEGETLREAIRRGRLAADVILRISVSLLKGLKAAHAAGIIHRDIKPENIFLTSDGSVKLLDFGLAKLMGDQTPFAGGATELTMPGSLMGTISYMAPEQLRGDPVDERTDLYSLGMVLYEAATGSIPTRKKTIAASMTAVLREAPPPLSESRPDLPLQLSELVFRATRKEASDRCQSAADMLALLGQSGLSDGILESGSWTGTVRHRAGLNLGPAARRPLVGREEECRVLQDFLSEARCGRGRMVLIEGEPGIGKTRLLEHILGGAAEAGMNTLVGRCSESETGTPFLPFVQILERLARESDPASLAENLGPLAPEIGRLTPRIRRALPDIPAPLEVPPERERYLLFSAVTEFIERLCSERPVLLALEDLHWADAATSALIQHIASNLQSQPLLIVGTHRLHVLEENSAFSATLGHLLSNRLVRRLTLHRLSDAAVNLQLRELAGKPVPPEISQEIHQITEGNPFFVEELFDHLRHEALLFDENGDWKARPSLEDFGVPEGILLVLGRRIKRLSERTHKLIQTAAVLGRTFKFELLARCLGEPPAALIDALEEAGRFGLVFPATENGDVVYAFSHALVRQALVDIMSPPRRQATHLRVAEILEALEEASDAGYAIDIARHLASAGSLAPPDRKLEYLSRAGDEALAKTAFHEAADFYERAMAFVRKDPGTRGDLLFRKGLAFTGLTLWERAHSAWTEALELLEQAGNLRRVGELCDILSSHLIWLGQLDAAQRVSRRAIAVLGNTDPVRRARLLAWAGHSLSQEGKLDEGAPLTEEALAAARELGDTRLIGHVFTHKACEAFYRMRYSDQAEAGSQAITMLAGYPWDHLEGRVFELLGLLGIGELQKVRHDVREALAEGTRIGHIASLWMLRRILGMTDLLESGDIRAFKAFASTDLESCRQAQLKWISEAHTWLGLAEWWSGELDRADRHFEEAVALEPFDFSRGSDWGCRFAYLGFSGRRDEALGLLRETEEQLRRPPQTAGQWSRLLLTTLGLAWLGEWDRAGELYRTVLLSLDLGSIVLFNAVGLVQTVAGVAAGAAQLWEEAEGHFVAASRAAATIPHRIEQAEIDRWRAEFLLRRGEPADRERALSLLQRARQQYLLLKMPLHQRLAEQLLAGGSPRLA